MTNTKSMLFAGVAAVALMSGGAYAADLAIVPVEPLIAAAPAFDWNGMYFGGHVGGGFGKTNISRNRDDGGPPGIDTDNTSAGLSVGLQVGADHQSGDMVYGIVGDFAFTNIDGATPDGGDGPPSVWEDDYKWVGSLRARVGRVLNHDRLVYLQGGIAAAQIDTREVGGDGPWSGKGIGRKTTAVGWTAGLGVEGRIFNNTTAFIEYNYYGFGGSAKHTPDGPPGTLTFSNGDLHMIKVGVNLR